jgi:hypothetical protein
MKPEMSVLGIDIAKRLFHAVGMDERGTIVFRKRLSRHGLIPFIAKLPPVLIGMETCGGEGATPRPAVSCFAVRVVSRIPAAEFFYGPGGLDPLLPARPPRMTRGADGDAELWDRRAGGIGCATRAHNRCGIIGGMSCSLHACLLSYCCWVGYSVWPALRADCDGAERPCPRGQIEAGARGLRRSGTVRGPARLSRSPTEHGSTACPAGVPVRQPRAVLAAPCAPAR